MPQMMPLGWAWLIMLLVFVYFLFLVNFYYFQEVEVVFSGGWSSEMSGSWEW